MNSVNIYLEANPNPNSLKFVADRMLLDDKIIKDYPRSTLKWKRNLMENKKV